MHLFISYIKDLITEFKQDNVPLLAAAQAYYYLLAIVPLLIVCFAVIPYFQLNTSEVMAFLDNMLPSGLASIFEDNIINLVETPKGGLLTVGLIGALWSTSNGINAFIKATNQAYNTEETRSFIKVRFIALILTIGMILSIIIAILLPVFGSVIINYLNSLFGFDQFFITLFQIARWIVSILVIATILLLLYYFAPNKRVPFKHIIPGALITSVLWLLISLGFSFYVSNFGNYSATYGSLGGIIILMIWFFLTGLILMIGAEINVIHHRRKSREIVSKSEHAL